MLTPFVLETGRHFARSLFVTPRLRQSTAVFHLLLLTIRHHHDHHHKTLHSHESEAPFFYSLLQLPVKSLGLS